MKRTATACLFVLVLLLALGAPGPQALSARSNPAQIDQPAGENGPELAPSMGGEGDHREPNPEIDSGDDDDYWEGMQASEVALGDAARVSLLQLILEQWWTASAWLF